MELREGREGGFGVVGIPSEAITAWSLHRGVPRHQFNFYHAVIRTIDRRAVAYKNDKGKEQVDG